MLNTICTKKEKNTGIFIFWDLQNGMNIIQFGELLLCAGTANFSKHRYNVRSDLTLFQSFIGFWFELNSNNIEF